MKVTVLMFSLWLMKIKAECPASCNCTTSSISCVDKNLQSIPDLRSIHATNPLILDFSGNQFLFLSKRDFDFPKTDEVIEIYLNNSAIADIGKGTFDQLDNLQELYLGQNLLTSVPDDMIEKLNNVILLDMSNNRFEREMPLIRSRSLEVLALVDSKITTVEENALYGLPNLKLLILNQNNIMTLSAKPFLQLAANSFFIKMHNNPLICNCDNLKTYYYLKGKGLLFDEELYECLDSDQYINILNISNRCGQDGQASDVLSEQIRDMVSDDSVKDSKQEDWDDFDSYEYKDLKIPELDIKDLNDRSLEVALSNDCWELDYDRSSRMYVIMLMFTMASFLIGFIGGAIFCRIMYTFRYKKLEQGSDSQTQLLRA